MIAVLRLARARSVRPFVVSLIIIVVIALIDGGQGRFLSFGTVSSVLQQFATVGPVALAIGLTMIASEFDLSVGGMAGLAGCVAVLTGASDPMVGIAAATTVGLAAGLVQGVIMVRLGLSSVAVTLGGLLTLTGIAYVVTDNTTVGYPRLDVAMLVNEPVVGIISIRCALALGAFIIAAFVMYFTRIGRDVVAVGSDRRSAMTAGVSVSAITIGVFAVSGLLTSLSGALLSYSLAAASPAALASTLVPAVAAAIIGGVSLAGGKGSPLGIAGGVLVLCILRSSMSSIGLAPYVQDIATGGVLLIVALMDADDLTRQLYPLVKKLRRGVPS
ncbi:ABC transporter permease [Agrobacterium arsenijevicii]|uniref:Xylose transport system permease protein XylH n=1 Tax=Agrobacterium arsenijevicii TaxID=1585697 RepID=A0ABR5CZ02_9HYPH|nr:hypothetical protein RP75_28675 [Agrobacterium arsenijevicii]